MKLKSFNRVQKSKTRKQFINYYNKFTTKKFTTHSICRFHFDVNIFPFQFSGILVEFRRYLMFVCARGFHGGSANTTKATTQCVTHSVKTTKYILAFQNRFEKYSFRTQLLQTRLVGLQCQSIMRSVH